MNHVTSVRFGLVGAALAVASSASGGGASLVDLVITLDGYQESPAVDTPATGAGTATLDLDTNLMSWSIEFSGLAGAQTAAHFHGAAPLCTNTGVQIGLPLGSPIEGSATLTNDQVADVLAGLWYVNVHTDAHPSGEIRGQVMPGPLSNPIPSPIPPGALHVRLETVATGLTAPNWGTSAPGDATRLFVTDQDGRLHAIDLASGAASIFLDVSDLLVPLGVFGEGTFDERGLLGVAFHPDYQANGLLYTYTSQPVRGEADFSTMPEGIAANHQAVITEWTVPDPGDPSSVVDPGSARVLLRVDEPQFNHNAGDVVFGPDQMLYVSFGDGGGGDDQDGQLVLGAPMVGHGCIGNGQNAETILGSVIRIDPLGSNSANGSYGIPADNPFAGGDPRLDEIYAYGLRNPFRFSFDALTGAMLLPDVGQNDIEEINVGVSGGNYGWNDKEGSFYFVPNGVSSGYATDVPLAVAGGLVDPIAEYDHDEGIAVVGGFVYRGTKIPSLAGRYVFGEFAVTFSSDGRLLYLDDLDEIVEFQLVDQKALGVSVLGFGSDANGELYLLANTTGVPFGDTGVVLKIVTKPGDFDADGVTTFDELLSLLSHWGRCPGCPEDIDGDGVVGPADLMILIASWGPVP